MKDSKSLQPAWVFLPFCIEYGIWLLVCHRVWGAKSVVSLSSRGCWGGERLFLKSGEAAGSLKTFSLDCKSFSRSILHLLPVSLGSFICFLSTGPNQSSGSCEEAVTTGNCDTSLPRQTGIMSGVKLGVLGTKAGRVEGERREASEQCLMCVRALPPPFCSSNHLSSVSSVSSLTAVGRECLGSLSPVHDSWGPKKWEYGRF